MDHLELISPKGKRIFKIAPPVNMTVEEYNCSIFSDLFDLGGYRAWDCGVDAFSFASQLPERQKVFVLEQSLPSNAMRART